MDKRDRVEQILKRADGEDPAFPHGPSIKWPKVYQALRRDGMDKSKAAAISNAHWNKYRRYGRAGAPGPRSAAEYEATRGRKARRRKGIPLPPSRQIQKHYGPGPHPGTNTPQSIHRGGISEGGVQPPLFGDSLPNPVTNVVFRHHDIRDISSRTGPDPGGLSSSIDRYLAERDRPARDFNQGEYEAVLAAVEEAENILPRGSLPDEIEIVLTEKNPNSFAWVDVDHPNRIYIDAGRWSDNEAFHRLLRGDDFVVVRSLNRNLSTSSLAEDIEHLKRGTILHELFHVAETHSFGGKDRLWQNVFPSYDRVWFADKMADVSDGRLPSPYATENWAEFFAEAMLDYTVNGENASPHSVFTAEQFRRFIDVGRDIEHPSLREAAREFQISHSAEVNGGATHSYHLDYLHRFHPDVYAAQGAA